MDFPALYADGIKKGGRSMGSPTPFKYNMNVYKCSRRFSKFVAQFFFFSSNKNAQHSAFSDEKNRSMSLTRLAPVLAALLLLLPFSFRVQGSTLVELSQSADSSARLSVQSEGTGWRYLSEVDLYIVDPSGEPLLKSLDRQGVIARQEPDTPIQLEGLPDDPMVSDQFWIAEGDPYDLGILDAWSVVTGSPQIHVAIIDTGIDLNHPDLKDNVWTNPAEVDGNGIDDDGNGYVDDLHGYDFREGNPDVTDQNNHGTHLAGIIGALGNNGIGVTGINWKVSLMPLKFTDGQGNGTTALAVEAINYAIHNGANIINASWTVKSDEEDLLLKKAIEKAGEEGILFVTAAGNQFKTGVGLNIDESSIYPAKFALSNLIAVAALDLDGLLAYYSNYGPESVSLAAPGSSIFSTLVEGNYGVMDGTSLSAAFVSGAAALLLSARPELTAVELISILENSVTSHDSLSGLVSTGGSLNLRESMASLVSDDFVSPPPEPETSPPPSISEASAESPSGCNLVK